MNKSYTHLSHSASIQDIYGTTNMKRKKGVNAIYIHTEGTGKFLMNILETIYCI
jgi:hypothetical protein